jgi:hypothetical protein
MQRSPAPTASVTAQKARTILNLAATRFVDQHRVGEAKFADRGGDLHDLLVAVRARVSGVGDQRRAPAPQAHQSAYHFFGRVGASRTSSWATSVGASPSQTGQVPGFTAGQQRRRSCVATADRRERDRPGHPRHRLPVPVEQGTGRLARSGNGAGGWRPALGPPGFPPSAIRSLNGPSSTLPRFRA